MNFKNLEEEFCFYLTVTKWQIMFRQMKLRPPLGNILTMNEIVNSIIIGIATGISTVEASNNFENLQNIISKENTESLKIFLSRIISDSKDNLESVTRNFRSFNPKRLALVFTEVYKILEKENIDSLEKVSEKILIPSLESISENEDIENDKDIRSKWAYLISSEAKGNKVHPKFLAIINILDKSDVILLDYLYGRQFHRERVDIIRLEVNLDEDIINDSIHMLLAESLCQYKDVSALIPPISQEDRFHKTIGLSRLGEKFMSIVAPDKSYEFKVSQDTAESSF